MAQTADDKWNRLLAMLTDGGNTWDLSTNDEDAIRHVLGMVNAMADELAKRDGSTVPTVKDQFAAIVEAGEEFTV